MKINFKFKYICIKITNDRRKYSNLIYFAYTKFGWADEKRKGYKVNGKESEENWISKQIHKLSDN